MPKTQVNPDHKTTCYHCGDECNVDSIKLEDKNFCCTGCKSVFQILDKNNLCEYYNLSENPGVKINEKTPEKFSYLDRIEVAEKLILFKSENQNIIKFYIPIIHCSSCIFLLEQLNKIHSGITASQVNFLKKEITINYQPEKIQLSKIAGILSDIGYEPWISMENLDDSSDKKNDNPSKNRIYKIGIAGFCFANIMMLSFPEYFGIKNDQNNELVRVFSFLNLSLSLPVFFYSASGFFLSAYKSLRKRFLNIDAPIALAILITFTRSVYEILSQTGAGYLDSMSGIVFFMLLGRYFQDKTHEAISFNKNYRSYFPLGVTKIEEAGKDIQVAVSELKIGNRIKIRDNEIVPGDAILFRGNANIDYSFVTGESEPVEKCIGEIIYAGGRQRGEILELEIIKEVSGSYLADLWKNSAFKNEKNKEEYSFVHTISKYFALCILIVAFSAFAFWQFQNSDKAWLALTSVLIIACPCTLLLSSTFTYGNMQNVLTKVKMVVKNAMVIEKIAETDTIVFDKTGTLTQPGNFSVFYEGSKLNNEEKIMISSISHQSTHPYSRAIHEFLYQSEILKVGDFTERSGFGIEGYVIGNKIKLGSARFVITYPVERTSQGSEVHVAINGLYRGKFVISGNLRDNIEKAIFQLKEKFKVHILSGDNEQSGKILEQRIGKTDGKLFGADPKQKLQYIKELEKNNQRVMMLGDGLNDAGALVASNTGIAITDDLNHFTPASSAILHGDSLIKLPQIISYCKMGRKIILISFAISLLYNIIGFYFAVQAELQPVIAAVLMPVSSLSIILFSWLLTNIIGIKLLNGSRQKN